MLFFVDTAEKSEIQYLAETGFLDGVTTNPSLVAKAGQDFKKLLREICDLVPGPVSAEVAAQDTEGMIAEGLELMKIASNIVIKLPITWPALKACRMLSDHGVRVNMTLCFDVTQALLAAKAGAFLVSPFLGRLDDVGSDGVFLIEQIRQVYDVYDFPTKILAASIRSTSHVRDVALLGADAVTAPPAIFRALAAHPLTDRGIDLFNADWAKTNQSIL